MNGRVDNMHGTAYITHMETTTALTDLDGTTSTFAVASIATDRVYLIDIDNDGDTIQVTRKGFDAGRIEMLPLSDWN